MPCRARIFENRSQSRAMPSDVTTLTGHTATMRGAVDGLQDGLILICMMPCAFSCKSVTYADVMGHVQIALMHVRKKIARFRNDVHGSARPRR